MENQEQFILEDKKYFKETIAELINLVKFKNKEIDTTKHVAKHPNGETNVAFYDPKTGLITQYNCVTEENPKGTSILIYKLFD